MSKNTKRLIILTAGLLFISWLMSGRFTMPFSVFDFWNKNVSHGEGKTFSVSKNISAIDIISQTGDIRFEKSNDRSAKVIWSGNSSMKFSVRSGNGRLQIRENYKLPWFLRIGLNIKRAEIRVFLPAGTYKELDIETDTGSISVPAGFNFSDAELETDTGSVDFRASVSKKLKIHTDTGRIACSGGKPEDLELRSDTGQIDLSGVKGSGGIRLKTDTGKVAVTDVSCGKLSAESDTGSLSLTNVQAAGKMDLETDTGAITLNRCDAQSLKIESDTGSVKGTLLSDKIFKVRTKTGKVDVPLTDRGGYCEIKTDTGNITIMVSGNR